MNKEKLSSDEVPAKFAEWLLAMGCPADKVPTPDKISLMCRGEYYMVWRSLMEYVEPKNIIREKRLQVFCNDIAMCQKRTAFNQNSSIIPDQLSLWQQQKRLRDKVSEMETRLKQSQETLKELMEKISTKTAQRNKYRQLMVDLQRRLLFLQRVSEELQTKKESLDEITAIANSLCSDKVENDIQGKVEKCVAALRRQVNQTSSETSLSVSSVTSVASSAISSQGETVDCEDLVSSLAWKGDLAWTQIRSKRVGLANALQAANAREQTSRTDTRLSTQYAVAHTASLHCSLALEAMKNRVLFKQTHDRLRSSISELSATISGDACELLVVRCEKAQAEANVNALRKILNDLASKDGVFKTNDEEVSEKQNILKQIETMDKAIELKRDEVRKVVSSLTIIEKKIHNFKECLVAVFKNFQKESPINMNYEGIQLDLPEESISTLRQFYEERRDSRKRKPDLSFDLDMSECSFGDVGDSDPSFVEELKMYLKKFNLEKNKKLVLDSGEKIWIFETVQSLVSRLQSQWLSEDVSCSLVCPSVGLQSLQHLADEMEAKENLAAIVKKLDDVVINKKAAIDLTDISEREAMFVDKMKKSISSNLTTLQQCVKTLEIGQENLKFWADNELRNYISKNRTVNGMTYKECEKLIMDNII